MKSPTIIFATCGRWQAPAILAAKSLGFSCLGIDSNPNAYGFNFCDNKIVVDDLNDISLILKVLNEKNVYVKGVISYCSDAGQRLTFALREHFDIPTDQYCVTENFLDKGKQRKIWDNSLGQSVRWKLFTELEVAKNYIYSQSNPVVIKPVDAAGSRGVNIFDKSSFTEAIFYLEESFNHSKKGQIIIEEFIEGVEYTMDAFSYKGKVFPLLITEKIKVSDNLKTVSSELHVLQKSVKLHSEISNFVAKAINALGKENGPTHSELMVQPDGKMQMIESAARGGGFNLASKLLPMVSGINYPLICIKEAAGILSESDLKINAEDLTGKMRFLVAKYGVVSSIKGFNNVSDDGNSFAEAFVNPGDVLSDPSTDSDRTGCLIAVGSTQEEVISRMAHLERETEVEINT